MTALITLSLIWNLVQMLMFLDYVRFQRKINDKFIDAHKSTLEAIEQVAAAHNKIIQIIRK